MSASVSVPLPDDERLRLEQRIMELEAELEETYRSITELTNSVEGEREKFHRFERGLESEFCFYTLSVRGELLYVSESASTIFGFQDLDKLHPAAILTEHPINNKKGRVWEALLAGEIQPAMEWEIEDGDGNLRRIERMEFPVFDSEGQVRYIEGIARDITQQRVREIELLHARDQAEKAHRAKSMFLSHMSHELRTPLNGVLGYVQLLSQDGNLSTEQRESLKAIESCGRHLLTLINRVLDFSKIEGGGVLLEEAPCRLHDLLQEIHDIVAPHAVQKKLELIWEIPKSLPSGVVLDAIKFKQVLINLLSNAIKFTNAGSVMLQVMPKGGKLWRFRVKDTGIGIDPSLLSVIFDPFRQAEVGSHMGGTGLGLAISQRIVDAMGGILEVRSEPGQGSEFYFSLELEPVDAITMNDVPVMQFSSDALRRLQPGHRLQVLVVDDQETNQDVLCQMLKRSGMEVLTASSGKEAIRLWEEHRMPLIFMDLHMPDMDGLETVRVIRNWRYQSQPVIFAISATVSRKKRNAALRAGCQGFIPKPFPFASLLEQVEKYFPHSFEAVNSDKGKEIPPAVPDVTPLPTPNQEEQQSLRRLETQLRKLLTIGDFRAMEEEIHLCDTLSHFPILHERFLDAVRTFDFVSMEQLLLDLQKQATSA